MAAGMMAAAMVPIAHYFYSSAQQQARMKAETIAANYAAKVMNEYLDEKPFDEVVDSSESGIVFEGVTIDWELLVTDIQPSAITFTWDDSVGLGGGLGPGATAAQLDSKWASETAIKDLRLEVQWQSPRDATMGGPRRTQVLCTRRARLAEAGP